MSGKRGPHDRRALVVRHEAFPQMRRFVIRLAVSVGMFIGAPQRAAESTRHDERRRVYHAGIVEVGTVPGRTRIDERPLEFEVIEPHRSEFVELRVDWGNRGVGQREAGPYQISEAGEFLGSPRK
jgi:hypothetical protein